jgi:hypothetical protein
LVLYYANPFIKRVQLFIEALSQQHLDQLLLLYIYFFECHPGENSSFYDLQHLGGKTTTNASAPGQWRSSSN